MGSCVLVGLADTSGNLTMAGTITTISKLEPSIQALCEERLKAMLKSYSPYSKFKVGAAIQCGDNLISGCNVENASYGLTVCAERTAVVKAVSEGITEMDCVAIAAHVEGDFVGLVACADRRWQSLTLASK